MVTLPPAAASRSTALDSMCVWPSPASGAGEDVLEEIAAPPVPPLAKGADGRLGMQRSTRTTESSRDKGRREEGKAALASTPRLGKVGKVQPR